MREIGTLPDAASAQRLADYLLTRSIATKVVAGKAGHTVWARREEQVDEARKEFAEFRANPDDPRYDEARAEARAIRKQEEREEAIHRKNSRRISDVWSSPLWQRAPVTFAFLALSTVVFFAMASVDGYVWVRRWLMFSTLFIDQDGFVTDSGLAEIRSGQLWRVLTPMFVHFGVIHFAFNMSWLINLGQRIEWVKGRWKLLAIIFVTGIASNIGQFASTGGNFGGMSGVVYGLFGYILTAAHYNGDSRFRLHSNAVLIMVGWLVLGFVTADPRTGVTWMGPIANTAHGVGFVSGLLMGLSRF